MKMSDFYLKNTSMAEKRTSRTEMADNPLHSNLKSSIQHRRQNYSFKIVTRSRKSVFLLLSCLLIMHGFLIEISEGSPNHYCLRHCHMCKEMYGRHFMIHLCKDDCMESRGRFVPDCLDLNSIRDYLILTDGI